jgi:hypothetical protein
MILAVLCDKSDPLMPAYIFRHVQRVIMCPTILAMLGLLFVKTKGEPSGDVATIIFNTMAGWMGYCLAYCRALKGHREFMNLRDMEANVRLRVGGDDSAMCLSQHMRAWCVQSGIDWAQHVVTTFADLNWTLILNYGELNEIEFMGYRTIVADLRDHMCGVWHLPALPLGTVQSINEWYKKAKNDDVPMPVKDLARYYACVEKAFPHLWSDDPVARKFVQLPIAWLDRQREIYRHNPCWEIASAARGIPTLLDIANTYFPVPIPLSLIYDRLRE